MKLILLIAAVCLFAIAAFLGFAVDSVNLRDMEALGLVASACFAGSFLPIP